MYALPYKIELNSFELVLETFLGLGIKTKALKMSLNLVFFILYIIFFRGFIHFVTVIDKHEKIDAKKQNLYLSMLIFRNRVFNSSGSGIMFYYKNYIIIYINLSNHLLLIIGDKFFDN